MKPGVFPVYLISMTNGETLAETSLEYCEELYVQKNLVKKPGAFGSGKREDGSSDGGASGDGASGGRSSGGGSSREGTGGSGASGDGTGGTGDGGCGGKGCGTYSGGATGCQYRRDACQPGSDRVSKLCELIQKCSVGIQRQEPSATQNKACTEAEEDLEDDQLLCTQESNENYFADTEDCSSVSSETNSALSDLESGHESLSELTAVHNVSTAIQKKASEAMDMLQLEMRRVVGKVGR
nr:keratin, type II cytoskeletal 1-like [Pocillopora verrucosa]